MKLQSSYLALPNQFYTKMSPSTVSTPTYLAKNYRLASELGISKKWLDSAESLGVFSGNQATVEPNYAMVYAGHQFGYFSPQLGDGRALVLGELKSKNGVRYDIQLKGSGQTPYSRNGDGKSPIGPVIREYLLSEAMHYLGVPTTRSLAAIETGDSVYRETELQGGVLTRVAKSLVRVGTFQYFYAIDDFESVKLIADYSISRLYPELKDTKEIYLDFLSAVVEKQAYLLSQWMSLGFIHGVLNTDNTAISGETIDYGPCAFMEGFDPGQVFSAIDIHGRYAYSKQPEIIHWNLLRLAETLLPLIDAEEDVKIQTAQDRVDQFFLLLANYFQDAMFKKLGFLEVKETDKPLLDEFLMLVATHRADFTLSFRCLSHFLKPNEYIEPFIPKVFETDAFKTWLNTWKGRVSEKPEKIDAIVQAMDACNPLYIPRNHIVQEAIDEQDEKHMHKLSELWKNPYDYKPGFDQYISPANDVNRVTTTFCGT